MSNPEYENIDEFIAAHQEGQKAPDWPENAPWLKEKDDSSEA